MRSGLGAQMSVWVCFPSKRPLEVVNKVLQAWHDMGYSSVVMRDSCDPVVAASVRVVTTKYEGWGASMNFLARQVFAMDKACDWVVAASDDIYPDPNVRAEEIARQCDEHFFQSAVVRDAYDVHPTFGVMQPTGDLKAWPASRIDRICGSPWLGREFCRRMYQGNGPFWPEYRHMFDDEELFEVSKKARGTVATGGSDAQA
jgi:hypothetical protein